MKKFYYLLGGAALAVLVIAPAIYLYNNQVLSKLNPKADNNFLIFRVTPLGNNAYGS